MKIKKNNKNDMTYEEFFNSILDDVEEIEEKENELYPNGDEDLKNLTLEEKVDYLMDAVKKINGILMINNRAIELFINDLDNIHYDMQETVSMAMKTQLIFTASVNVLVNKMVSEEMFTQDEYIKELYSALKTASEIYKEEGYEVTVPDIVSQYTNMESDPKKKESLRKKMKEEKTKKTKNGNVLHFTKFKKETSEDDLEDNLSENNSSNENFNENSDNDSDNNSSDKDK